MRCTTCDHVNPDEARFCSGCGATLVAVSPTNIASISTEKLANTVTPSTLISPATSPIATHTLTSAQTALPSAPSTPLATASMPALVSPMVVPVNVNVTVHAVHAPVISAPPIPVPVAPVVVLAQHASGPGWLTRGIYFVFVGRWLGAFWTMAAWFLLASIIGLPIGLLMLNRLPQVMTLKAPRTQTHVTVQGNAVVVTHGMVNQHAFAVRAIYFVFVGWWLSGAWLGAAWFLLAVSLGLALPLSFWMFDRTPAIVSLARQ